MNDWVKEVYMGKPSKWHTIQVDIAKEVNKATSGGRKVVLFTPVRAGKSEYMRRLQQSLNGVLR